MLPSDHLELDAPDFDSEWKWIGSYSTFRAATFVRLYPDNLLLPSLITHQTPAFSALVEQTRPTKRLTPQDVCTLAQTYSSYLHDVSSLDIAATCQVETQVNKNDPCKTAAPVRKNLLYMFGRATSGKVYWSSIDPTDRSGYAQSFWSEVSLAPKDGKATASKVVNIIGALPWLDPSVGQHYIYLFLDIDELGVRKLKGARLDLSSYTPDTVWRSEPLDLDVSDLPRNNWGVSNPSDAPIAVQHLTILPVQSDSVLEPPQLAIHQPNRTFYVFVRPLDAAGSGWKEGDWKDYQIEPRYNAPPSLLAEQVDKLEAALRVNKLDWLVYRHGKSRRAYAVIPGGLRLRL